MFGFNLMARGRSSLTRPPRAKRPPSLDRAFAVRSRRTCWPATASGSNFQVVEPVATAPDPDLT